MISFLESILGTVLSSFVIIIIATFMALLVDFLFPSFAKWTRMILIFIVVTVVLQPAFEHLTLIRDIANSISMMFISIYPILTASMVAAGGAFSMLNFQPAMLLFANGAIVLTEKVLIPLLTAALILDLVSRILPAVPFTKMADLIRTTLLGTVSAVVAAYSIFITVGGTMTWALTGLASEPIKELIRQNVPLIGSFMTESMGTMGRYSSGASVFAGGWLISAIWTVALIPSFKTLLTAFFYRWTAALIEPFANEDITGILDDIGRTLFVLCAVSFLIAFAFIYTALFSIILVKLITTMK
ncbi:stage III sporulation protein AE [Sporosarcina sp. FSL K6-1540]|uniref:Stage III sporulation protein AE n=1 Tax=Sporosarcina psychrophila TaxID=1476 RepID=A0ABV2KBH1_SPOPS|nr:stage III sporulation protein AE [Sporosarcina sp. resist]QNK86380.1 stage III sporulation protein AE [Sporosarcina sp. resist]